MALTQTVAQATKCGHGSDALGRASRSIATVGEISTPNSSRNARRKVSIVGRRSAIARRRSSARVTKAACDVSTGSSSVTLGIAQTGDQPCKGESITAPHSAHSLHQFCFLRQSLPGVSADDVPLRCAVEADVEFAPVQILLIRENAVELRDCIIVPKHFRQRGLDALSRADILVAFRTGIGDVRCDRVEKFSDRAIAKKPRPVYPHAGVHIRGLGGVLGKAWVNFEPARRGSDCSRPRNTAQAPDHHQGR